MISFVGELSSSNDKNDAVNFSSDWRRHADAARRPRTLFCFLPQPAFLSVLHYARAQRRRLRE